jgi:hypothetical protein
MKLSAFFCILPAVVVAEVESNIPLGVEAVTGYRTEYIHRGMSLADDVIDFQLESGFALSDTWSIGLGGWHAAGTASEANFSETSGSVELRYDEKSFSSGWALGYRSFSGSQLIDGLETGPFCSWHATADLDVNAELRYDDGARTWYAKAELYWSKPLDKKSFVSALAGISAVGDYYDRKGLNDVFLRISYTYNVASNVSLTPFLGSSIGLDEIAEDRGYGGVWFEVSF